MISLKERNKRRRIAALSVLSVLVVAILCLVFGFAIAEGWETVWAWFKSPYATLLVVFVAVVAAFAIYFLFGAKDKEDFK